jgi:hypothetical protein
MKPVQIPMGPAAWLLVVAMAFLSGCGTSPDEMIRQSTKTNIARVANLYTRYQLEHSGKGPKNEAEFKQFVAGLDARVLERIGIQPGNTEVIFNSDRDSEPLVIRWGVDGTGRGPETAIVLEKVGVSGSRQVAFTTLAIREVTDQSEYDKYLSGKPFDAAAAGGPSNNSNLPPGARR